MTNLVIQGTEPIIKVDSLGIGINTGIDDYSEIEKLNLSDTEYLVVGDGKGSANYTSNTYEGIRNMYVNSRGVSINTSRNIYNKSDANTSLYVSKNIHCDGIIRANGIQFSNITIEGTLTSNLVLDLINAVEYHKKTHPFKAGIALYNNDINDIQFPINNVYTQDNLTLGAFVDTNYNKHALNINTATNNDFNSIQLAIRNDTKSTSIAGTTIDSNLSKLSIGIIGANSRSPAVISTTRGMPLEFHVSKTPSEMNLLYDNKKIALPRYVNDTDYAAMTIDENANVCIGIDKSETITYFKKSLINGIYSRVNEEIVKKPRLVVKGASKFEDVIIYDHFKKQYNNIDDIYIRAEGLTNINPSVIKRGTFFGDEYIFNNNVNVINLLTTSNISSKTLDSKNINSENITINTNANFTGTVNFNPEKLLEINKLKITNFLEVDGYRINPEKNGGSNYFYTFFNPAIVNIDANSNISFPKRLSIGPSEGDFPGIVNVYKNNTPVNVFEEVQNNRKFEIILQDNTMPDKFVANIGRISYVDFYDNSLIINTNVVNGKENNIYFYPSYDITKLQRDIYNPNFKNSPPSLSITNKGVGININIPRQDLRLDIVGKMCATEYSVSKYNIISKISSFIYDNNKNYFNLFNEETYKYCINYDSSASMLSSKMKGLNVKQGINADLYYQNDTLIETLRITKNTDGFFTNQKIALGWNEEDLKVPLQIRNISTDDHNYSIIRIYRGLKGGGLNNNANFSGIDICEYDRDLDDDRNLEKWFIYRNHKHDLINIKRVGPLQFGYTDKTITPTTYGMTMYYNNINSNYHIEFNNPDVSYEFMKKSSISAVSIYGDLDVYGNINIIDNNSNNFNFRLKKLEKLSELEYYVNVVSTSNFIYKNFIDHDDIEYSGKNIIFKPIESIIVDSTVNNNIPFVVKQNNHEFSTAKFITYPNILNSPPQVNSSIELGIYKKNEFTTAYDSRKATNINNMIKFNVSNDTQHVNNTKLTFSYYSKEEYYPFIEFNNNSFSKTSYMHLGYGVNEYDSNITLHIDDNNKCGIQITNIEKPVKINMVNTSGSRNKYTILSSGNYTNKYKFSIDIDDIPSTVNQLRDRDGLTTNIFTIAPYNENNNMRKGARYGFNEKDPKQTVVINSEMDELPLLINQRYTEDKIFTSAETNTCNFNLVYTVNSNWDNINKTYKSTEYKYTTLNDNVINIDINGYPIDAKNVHYKKSYIAKNISYSSIHSNILIDFYYNDKTNNITSNNNYKLSALPYKTDEDTFLPDYKVNFYVDEGSLYDIEPLLNYDNNVFLYKDPKNIKNYETSNVFILNKSITTNQIRREFTFNMTCIFNNKYNIPANIGGFITSNFIITSNIHVVGDKVDINLDNEIYTYFPDTTIDNYTNSKTYFNNTTSNYIDTLDIISTSIYLTTKTSNIFRYKNNILYNNYFDVKRTNNITVFGSNIFPSTTYNSNNILSSNNILEYNEDIGIDTKNIIDLQLYNNIIDTKYNTEIKYLSSNTFVDTFTINGARKPTGAKEFISNFSNIIILSEFYGSYVNNSNINVQVNKINIQGVNPHITLANSVENQPDINDVRNEIYSYDGNLRISLKDNSRTADRLLIKNNGDTIFYGSIYTSNDLYVDGRIYSDGINVIDSLSDSIYKISSNIASSHKENLYNIFDLRINDDIVRSSNYIASTSNIISRRIANLNTDMIKNTGTRNKFIVDNIYDAAVYIKGNLTVRDNLIIEGTSTTLQTTVYTTERLEVSNEDYYPVLNIQQKNPTYPYILEAKNYTSTTNVLTLSKDGDININGKYKCNDIDVIVATSNYVLSTCNILVEELNIRDINISNYILAASNYFGDLIVSKSPWIVTNSNIYYSSNVNITGQLYIEGDVTVTGFVVAGGPINANQFSDNRLKNQTSNIRNPIDLISKLNGFHYIPNGLAQQYGFKEKNDIGLSAQEVQNIFPEIVSLAPFDMKRDNYNNIVSKSGDNYLTINYEKLAPLFVESIKDLKKELNELKLEIAELRNNGNK